MTWSETTSLVALIVSISSLGFSLYFNFRDRGQIHASSKFYPSSSYGPQSLTVTIVNTGRRPVILRMWGGADSSGKWVGHFFNGDKSGLRLGEHERHDFVVEKNDAYSVTPVDEIFCEDLWVEDTLGRRIAIKDAKANLARLWKS